MTNKFYNEIATLSVYITNLDEYVKGNLIGDWISLPIKKRTLEISYSQLATLKK